MSGGREPYVFPDGSRAEPTATSWLWDVYAPGARVPFDCFAVERDESVADAAQRWQDER